MKQAYPKIFKPLPVQIAIWLTALGLLGHLSCAADLAGDWPTYGGGVAHTGYLPGSLKGVQFVLKWQATMPNWNILQPAVGGGRVFVSCGWYFGAMYLKALDANTGQELWSKNFASAYSINPPTCDNGAVYVQLAVPSSTMSFDAATGAARWQAPFISQSYNYLAPIVANGTVYANTGYYVDMTGYNRTNGSQQFSVSLIGNGCDRWTPAYDGGKIYTWVNGYFAEHDPLTGAQYWTLTNATSAEFLYSMDRTVAISDGRAYFTSTKKLMVVDLALKTNLWQIEGSFSGTPAVANGKVYAVSNGVVNAYTTDGALVNTYSGTNWGSFSGQLIVTDDVLVAASDSGVYVFNLSDATVQQYITSYRANTGAYYRSLFSLANKTLYIASGDSNIYAYAVDLRPKLTINANEPGTQLTLRWPSETGRTYVLLFASNLSTTAFLPVSTNTATPPMNVLSRPLDASGRGFYQLQVQ